MKFECFNCLNAIEVGRDQLGQKVECENCSSIVQISDDEFGQGRMISEYKILSVITNKKHEIDLLCLQTTLEREVVVKLIKEGYSKNVNFIHNFIITSRAISKVYHPNICSIYEIGVDEGGNHYLVRESGDAQTLRDKLNNETALSFREALAIVKEVALGLDFGSDKGFFHFNLKPTNVVLYNSGMCKIADLAICTINPDSDEDSIIGTPQYLAPERIVGLDGDHRSDIYSLGVMLFYMLTGKLPFDHPDISTICRMHLETDLIPPSQFVGSIPMEVCAIVDRMMAKNPLDRYQNSMTLIKDIDMFFAGKAPEFAMPNGFFEALADRDFTSIDTQVNIEFDPADLQQPVSVARPVPLEDLPSSHGENTSNVKIAEPVDHPNEDELVGAGTDSQPIKKARSVRKPRYEL